LPPTQFFTFYQQSRCHSVAKKKEKWEKNQEKSIRTRIAMEKQMK